MQTAKLEARSTTKGIPLPKILEELLHRISWRFPRWIMFYDRSFLLSGQRLRLPTRQYTNYEIKLATEDDLYVVVEAGVDKERFLHRLRRGDTCFLVLKDGLAVGWSWATTVTVFSILGGHIVESREGGVLLYDVFAAPEERLKGFLPACVKRQLSHYSEQGAVVLSGIISVFNAPSLKAHLRMRFKVEGETIFFTVLGISLCYYKRWPGRTRRIHLFFHRPPSNMEYI